MKIIGKTYQGYICEVTKIEMEAITAQSETYAGNCHKHEIGVVIDAAKIKGHIDDMARSIDQRRRAADLLRSAAIIIDTVPDVLAPGPQPEESTANQ